jgi:hypothetical protein
LRDESVGQPGRRFHDYGWLTETLNAKLREFAPATAAQLCDTRDQTIGLVAQDALP